MEKLLLIIVVGVVGGLGAQKVGFPGGAVVGSMLASGIMALLVQEDVTIPGFVNTGIQLMLGVSLGMTFNRSFLYHAGKVFPLALVSTIVLLSVAVFMAFLAQRMGMLDFATAMYGFSPGGMTGMSILAQADGYSGAIVAFLHSVRIFSLFITVPLLERLVYSWARSAP